MEPIGQHAHGVFLRFRIHHDFLSYDNASWHPTLTPLSGEDLGFDRPRIGLIERVKTDFLKFGNFSPIRGLLAGCRREDE